MCSQLQKSPARSKPTMQMANQESEYFFFFLHGSHWSSLCVCWGTTGHCYLGVSDLLLHITDWFGLGRTLKIILFHGTPSTTPGAPSLVQPGLGDLQGSGITPSPRAVLQTTRWTFCSSPVGFHPRKELWWSHYRTSGFQGNPYPTPALSFGSAHVLQAWLHLEELYTISISSSLPSGAGTEYIYRCRFSFPLWVWFPLFLGFTDEQIPGDHTVPRGDWLPVLAEYGWKMLKLLHIPSEKKEKVCAISLQKST